MKYITFNLLFILLIASCSKTINNDKSIKTIPINDEIQADNTNDIIPKKKFIISDDIIDLLHN